MIGGSVTWECLWSLGLAMLLLIINEFFNLHFKKSAYVELALLIHLLERYIQPVCVLGFKKKKSSKQFEKKILLLAC